MNLFKKFLLAALLPAMVMSLGVSAANAGSKSGGKPYITGSDLEGRSGLIYGDTSDVAGMSELHGSVNLVYQSFPGGSAFSVPGGVAFGIEKDVELSLGGSAGFDTVTSTVPVMGRIGGKLKIRPQGENMPNFSAGVNVMLPITPTFVPYLFVTPEGTVTYTLEGGLLLNGDCGIAIGTSGGTYVKADAGAAYSFNDQIMVMAEIGANQGGNGLSLFSAGIRAGLKEFKVQGFVGIPLSGGNVLLGGGLTF